MIRVAPIVDSNAEHGSAPAAFDICSSAVGCKVVAQSKFKENNTFSSTVTCTVTLIVLNRNLHYKPINMPSSTTSRHPEHQLVYNFSICWPSTPTLILALFITFY